MPLWSPSRYDPVAPSTQLPAALPCSDGAHSTCESFHTHQDTAPRSSSPSKPCNIHRVGNAAPTTTPITYHHCSQAVSTRATFALPAAASPSRPFHYRLTGCFCCPDVRFVVSFIPFPSLVGRAAPLHMGTRKRKSAHILAHSLRLHPHHTSCALHTPSPDATNRPARAARRTLPLLQAATTPRKRASRMRAV